MFLVRVPADKRLGVDHSMSQEHEDLRRGPAGRPPRERFGHRRRAKAAETANVEGWQVRQAHAGTPRTHRQLPARERAGDVGYRL